MVNVCYKLLKVFLVLGVKKIDSLVISIFGIHVKFLDKKFLDEFTTVLLTLLSTLTTILLLAVNAFETKFDNSAAFIVK